MAKGKKTGGRNFQQGNPGGPGRPKMPEDDKLAWKEIYRMRHNLRYEWAQYFIELCGKPVGELRLMVGGKNKEGKVIPPSDPSAPVLKLTIARAILFQLSAGKAHELQALQEMMCGKEPNRVELSDPDGKPLFSPLKDLSTEQLAKAFSELQKIIKGGDCSNTSKSSSVSSDSSARSSRRQSPTAS